jgi:hypothetical protein
MNSKLTLSLLFSTALIFNSNAQKGIPGIDYRACSAAEKNNEILDNNPALRLQAEQLHQEALDWTSQHYGEVTVDATGKKTVLYVIPVVWHVIHDNNGANLSKATIDNEIAKLNEDFQKLNADIANVHPAFVSIAADVQVEFRLARLDPYGNCTEGITRRVNQITYAMDETAKTIEPSWNVNGRYYLNIWQGTAIASGAGGYAFYPGNVPMNRDGVVLIGGQLGNTVTHEVGHWLNLAHCWGSTNDPGVSTNCSSDDGVADTPNTIGQTGCSQTASSCSSVDNVQNYMEYNFCDVMFTEGQKSRMHAALNSASDVGKRKTMWSATNRTNTGTADPYEQNPICMLLGADFTYDKTKICEGETVTYNDLNTYNGTPTIWDWTFVGGTPSTSNVASPAITYNTAGLYSASYSPGTTAGMSPTVNKYNFLTVNYITAQYTLPYAENFEDENNYYIDWLAETKSGNEWQNTDVTGYTGIRSVMVDNLNNVPNDITELISTSYNLSTMTVPKLNWKAAYAKKVAGGNDILTVYSSIDCGSTWQTVTIKSASNLSSAPATDANFIPSGQSQWKDHLVTLSSTLASKPNVRFKFYFKSNGGNNIYLDDINIYGDLPTSIDEVKTVNNFTVYPNPTTESAVVSYTLTTEVKVLKITLKDVLGKEVTKIVNGQSFSAGKYSMSIDQGKKLASGLYFVEFNADNKIKVEKLIVK